MILVPMIEVVRLKTAPVMSEDPVVIMRGARQRRSLGSTVSRNFPFHVTGIRITNQPKKLSSEHRRTSCKNQFMGLESSPTSKLYQNQCRIQERKRNMNQGRRWSRVVANSRWGPRRRVWSMGSCGWSPGTRAVDGGLRVVAGVTEDLGI
ncbi:hypothetical protein QJS10_CPA08g00291 [Acorus calamus]|uniref:Uncharacterized protein n=1 Tax=Acorus calamus TaxID=4465 RepID=A0AAV9EDQ7_ACOCL|nr:hypothetical protein QJS10_CPA08g00291 [Acorus calamus]